MSLPKKRLLLPHLKIKQAEKGIRINTQYYNYDSYSKQKIFKAFCNRRQRHISIFEIHGLYDFEIIIRADSSKQDTYYGKSNVTIGFYDSSKHIILGKKTRG